MIRILLLLLILSKKYALAAPEKSQCNVNSECRPGFVCIRGIGADYGTENFNGYCEPMIPIRQICFLHKTITGIFGKVIMALVIVSFGFSFATGKGVEMKQLISLFAGLVCIFGSYQIISLIVKERYQMCDLIDVNEAPSTPPEYIK